MNRLIMMGVITLCNASTAFAQDYCYAQFEIETLGGENSVALSVNESGLVAGWAQNSLQYLHAITWSNGDLRDLDPQCNTCDSVAEGVNVEGAAAGTAGVRAVLWLSDGSLVDLGTLGGRFSAALDLNRSQQVVGEANYDPENFFNHPFLWENGNMIDLGTFGGEKGEASAINNRGQVVGTAWPPDGRTKPFLWENGQLIQLDVLGGEKGWSLDINDDELIVGNSYVPGPISHAVKWVNRQLVDIHDDSVAQWSSANGVNSNGVIIGNMNPRGTQQTTGFIIIDDHMVDLNTLAPPRRLRQLERVNGLNDAGVIVGETRGDPVRGAILSPVTPTLSLAAPVPGRAGRSNVLTATGVTPDARVHFVYGTYGGGTIIPGCSIQENALQIRNPTIVGTAIADANGVATITRHVPIIARGQTILFQAVVQNECAISQLVVHEFE
ncbi:MAG: hypothetical protein IT430_09770 [Phycisphaerales bacterium]|nr:hypothetical protein [Phycisphaerales bacterium]